MEEISPTIKIKVALRWRMCRILIVDVERPKKAYFKSAIRISRLIIEHKNFRRREHNEAKTPDALGSAADLCRRVQYSLVHFHFNCLYVDCITEWSVLL